MSAPIIDVRFVTLPEGQRMLQVGRAGPYGGVVFETPPETHWDWITDEERRELRSVLNLDPSGRFYV